jgi:hypothetical protein
MLNMLISKRSHEVITMIIIRLIPHIYPLHTCLLSSLFQIFGKELALFIEVVSSTLILPLAIEVGGKRGMKMELKLK